MLPSAIKTSTISGADSQGGTMASQRIESDVFICGTGPVGCTFARQLFSAGKKVVMADAGAQFSSTPGENLKNYFAYQRNLSNFTPIIRGLLHPLSVPPQTAYTTTMDPVAWRPKSGSIRNAMNPRQDPLRNLDGSAASYAVGGMSLHWTGNTPRHHPKLERVSFIGDEEWETLYGAAEKVLNTHTDLYDKSIRHTVVKETLTKFYGDSLPKDYGVKNLPVAGVRIADNPEFIHYTGAATVLEPVLGSDQHSARFQLLEQHRVRKLVQEKGGIKYAVVDDLLGGKTLEVYADTFVIAAGAVLTAQILFASGIRPVALGRYMIEHAIAFTQIVLKQEIIDSIPRRFSEKLDAVEPNDPVPIPMSDPPPMVWIPVSDSRPWHCQIHKDSFHYGEIPADVDDRTIVDLRWFARIHPIRENRVRFEEDVNTTFGMPQPTFEFVWPEQDRKVMHDMMTDMVEAAHALGGVFPGAEPRFMPSGLCLHVQGTVRMGDNNDETCVVDPFSRVWGLTNLYLGGNGVIPTANASNPTLTSVALALRSCGSILGTEKRLETGQLQGELKTA
jgi:pyranose oxidase